VLRTLLAMSPVHVQEVLPPTLRARLEQVAEVTELAGQFLDHPEIGSTEVLLTCWGCPPLTPEVLAAMPELRAVIHSAGSVKGLVGPETFARGVLVSSAAALNAIPVAEFAVAAIVLAGKRAFGLRERYRRERVRPVLAGENLGNYGITVGILGASRIGRLVLERLRGFDVRLLVSDPYLSADEAAALGAEPVELDQLFERSDVLSLHAPLLPATTGLVDARRPGLLRDGAVLVNTARGGLVDQQALERECAAGRIDAVLDVTDPEPPAADSPLYDLPNVFLTPHLAGALGNEIARLGEAAVGEIERLAAGRPLVHQVRAEDLDRIA
jgi:phosphoglycerate dehydrogenase-like enzyme